MTTDQMVARYKRSVDEPDEYTYDIVWTDRLTGKVVLRYDGADPANTSPSHGGCSDAEHFRSMGLGDINEGIELAKAVVPVDASEVGYFEARKRRISQREREDLEARDLGAVLGVKIWRGFDFERYSEGEENILKPALQRKGYRNVAFYMQEEDSFGPLIRGCVATDKTGKQVRFFYG